MAGQLWVSNGRWPPLATAPNPCEDSQLILEQAQLCHRKGVSSGAFHVAAQVNLLVSCSQRLSPDVPCLLKGQPALGAVFRSPASLEKSSSSSFQVTVGIYVTHLLSGKDTEWSPAYPANDPATVPTQSLLLLTLAPAKERRLSTGLVLCGAKGQGRRDFTPPRMSLTV